MKIVLPSVLDLRQRCQSLAALDLILSPEWEYRYFSFNSQWAPGQQMGSMRNGCGDEWFCLFHQDGWVGLKGLDHESPAWRKGRASLSATLQRGVPSELSTFSAEPAFRWDATSFAFYRLGDSNGWIRLSDATEFGALETGEMEHLSLLVSPPESYASHVADYFEREIDVGLVAQLFAHARLTDEIVRSINPELDLKTIESELFEGIAYPR